MSLNLLSTLQRSIYDYDEQQAVRLELTRIVDSDHRVILLEQQILELLRAGVEIAIYAVRAAAAHSASRSKIAYAAYLGALWETSVEGRRQEGSLLHHTAASFVTVRSFSSGVQGDYQSSPGSREDILVSVSRTLDEVHGLLGSQASKWETLSQWIAQESGYAALTDAARAQRPWGALSNIGVNPLPAVDLSLVSLISDLNPEAVRHKSKIMEKKFEQAETTHSGSGNMIRNTAGQLVASEDHAAFSAPPPFATSDREAAEIEPEEKPVHYKVWFGTDRARSNNPRGSIKFLNQRGDTNQLHYGVCTVSIPRSHRFGTVGAQWWRRWLPSTDEELRLSDIRLFGSRDHFASSVCEALATLEQTDRTVLVYVHGYNMSFKNAAIRAAQIGFDLKVPGITAFYSWPSKANKLAYLADAVAVEASERRFSTFLQTLVTETNANRVDLVIHSMGNRLFGRIATDMINIVSNNKSVPLGKIILAAPDIDIEVFRTLATAYPKISEKSTMYVSNRDKALRLSRNFQSSQRAGFLPPITVVAGTDTIEVSNIDISLLGHGYYAQSQPVIYDIKAVLDGHHDPTLRLRTTPKTTPAGQYWSLSS